MKSGWQPSHWICVRGPTGIGAFRSGVWLHCAYLFANKRDNRMKVLIHDSLGIRLCARRLNKGKFNWGETWRGKQLQLDDNQLTALVQGLPWQRVGAADVISVL